jgi:benzodiazapine receptor
MITYRTLIVLLVFIIGTLVTIKSMKNGWYKNSGIIVSKSQPPNYVFSVVWIFLYILYTVIWEYLAKHKLPKWLNTLFIINMVLNLAWTFVFFGYGDVPFSKVIILLLLILTFYQAYAIWKYTKAKWSGACAFSMLFYGAWLTAATGLNFDIKLNS